MLVVDYDRGTVSDKFVELYEHPCNLSAHLRFFQSIYLSYIMCVIQMQRVHVTRIYIHLQYDNIRIASNFFYVHNITFL